jgi:hypothetical protein
MEVQHIDADTVRTLRQRIADARQAATADTPEARRDADDPHYWQRVFESNAAAVLAVLPRVRLAAGHVVRYRFYGRQGSDLLVRPFVVRAAADVSTFLTLLDWHAPPDTTTPTSAATQDVELLYRYFEFEPTAQGAYEYWLAMQELWASQRWIHSTVLADASELSQLTAGPHWRIDRPVERVEPAVIRGGADASTQLAVLLHCPLERHTVTFNRVRIAPDQSIELAESLVVALGERGLLT